MIKKVFSGSPASAPSGVWSHFDWQVWIIDLKIQSAAGCRYCRITKEKKNIRRELEPSPLNQAVAVRTAHSLVGTPLCREANLKLFSNTSRVCHIYLVYWVTFANIWSELIFLQFGISVTAYQWIEYRTLKSFNIVGG